MEKRVHFEGPFWRLCVAGEWEFQTVARLDGGVNAVVAREGGAMVEKVVTVVNHTEIYTLNFFYDC